MRDVAISNPVINSPFEEPTRHFRFDDDGMKVINDYGDEALNVFEV